MPDDSPTPIVPAEVDLRDFAFMPLDVRRLLTSETWMLGSGDSRAAAMCLWLESWHQVPAGSLPDNDRILSHLSQSGPAWKKARVHALRGWVKCTDGRLYHPVVAEKAMEAWGHKQARVARTDAARAERQRQRELQQQSQALSQTSVTEPVTESKGQGQGQGQRDSESPPKPPKPEAILDLTSRLANAGGVSIVQPRRLTAALDLVKRWIGDGIDVEETILPTIAKRLADMAPSDTVGSLTYFDAAIRKVHALKAGGRRGEAPAPGKPIDDVDDDDERVARIREKLRRSVNARTYDGWLGPRITAMHINGVGLIVKAQTAFNADWIVNHFSGALSEAAKGEGIEAVRVEPI